MPSVTDSIDVHTFPSYDLFPTSIIKSVSYGASIFSSSLACKLRLPLWRIIRKDQKPLKRVKSWINISTSVRLSRYSYLEEYEDKVLSEE
jgi:hypothetical protein